MSEENQIACHMHTESKNCTTALDVRVDKKIESHKGFTNQQITRISLLNPTKLKLKIEFSAFAQKTSKK